MKVRAYITHKLEESNADCQDYFRLNSGKKKIAISDGVSQSIFSAKWAELLVKEYTDTDVDDISESIPKLQKKWQAYARQQLTELESIGQSTWMLENCLMESQGAGATFCGVHFDKDGSWDGYVLGDSCLLEVSNENKILTFYPSIENGFGNSPDYFDSFSKGRGGILPINGKLTEGNKLLLVTDPLGEFLYKKKIENKEQAYIEQLLALSSYNDFLDVVDRLRASEAMHNDDSTLIIVENDGREELSVVDSKTIEDLLKSEKLKYREETIQENKQIALEKLNSLTDKDLPKKCRKCKRSRELLNALNKKIKKFFNM